MTTPPAATAWAASTRILAGSLMGALLIMGVAVFFVLGDDLASPPVVIPLAQIAAGVVLHLLLETVGYRVAPLTLAMSADEAGTAARTRWQSGMVLRFALAESVAIVSLAGAFIVTEGAVLTYVGGALVSLVLMVLHVWPGSRPVGKVADALERDGRGSGLREAFGVA